MTTDLQTAGDEIILAIECAVGSGSVAILANERLIASTSGQDSRPSRAEEILGIIDQLLSNADVAIGDIRKIAVSAGPGSYSGMRIGLATALGLKDSLGITFAAIPLLEAMAASSGVTTTLAAAVPVGKKDIAWQFFGEDAMPSAEPELAPELEFLESLKSAMASTIVAHTDLKSLRDRLPVGIRFLDAGSGLAECIGIYASRHPGTTVRRPQYLRNRTHTSQIPT